MILTRRNEHILNEIGIHPRKHSMSQLVIKYNQRRAVSQTLKIMALILPLGLVSNTILANSKWQWDFDHKVSVRQTALKSGGYTIEVMPKNKTKFSSMATFMFRKSYEICNHKQYALKVIKGVQSFNEVIGSPNKIMPSFKAQVNCIKEK